MTNPTIDETVGEFRYPIRPSNIDTDVSQFLNSFGTQEEEAAAKVLVLFFQQKDKWDRFTDQEMVEFCSEKNIPITTFRRLIDHYVIREPDTMLRITHEFIVRCFRSAPKLNIPTNVVQLPSRVAG